MKKAGKEKMITLMERKGKTEMKRENKQLDCHVTRVGSAINSCTAAATS